jgi:hypothetical protein
MQLNPQPEVTLESGAHDPSSLRLGGDAIDRAVFIIPLDAPIPGELDGAAVMEGTLLTRLQALNPSTEPKGVVFLPLAGAEMLALASAWTVLVEHPRVMVLNDLPGAQYGVLFTQATRQIGIKKVEWTTLSDALAEQVRTNQRVTDKTPWEMKGSENRFSVAGGEVPNDLDVPPIDSEEQDEG